MTHYLITPSGVELRIEMGCNHPKIKGNSADSVGCNGDCSTCKDSKATLSIPEVLALIKESGAHYK